MSHQATTPITAAAAPNLHTRPADFPHADVLHNRHRNSRRQRDRIEHRRQRSRQRRPAIPQRMKEQKVQTIFRTSEIAATITGARVSCSA